MNKLFTSVTLATLLASSSAFAGEQKTVDGIALVAMYDVRCEKLPAHITNMAGSLLGSFSQSQIDTAVTNAEEQYQAMGAITWCSTFKRVMDKTIADAMR